MGAGRGGTRLLPWRRRGPVHLCSPPRERRRRGPVPSQSRRDRVAPARTATEGRVFQRRSARHVTGKAAAPSAATDHRPVSWPAKVATRHVTRRCDVTRRCRRAAGVAAAAPARGSSVGPHAARAPPGRRSSTWASRTWPAPHTGTRGSCPTPRLWMERTVVSGA